MVLVWLLFIGAILQVTSCAIVPPLFDYDNLTQCRQNYATEAIYCYVKVVTKGRDPFRNAHDAHSTRLVQQFRRNLLDHAVCVQDCEREVAELGFEDRERLYCEEFPVGFRHLYNTMHWREELEPFKQKYSKLINICVNNRLERRYNLTYHGHSKIEYCLSNEGPNASKQSVSHALKLLLFAIISVLVVTLLVTNLLDVFGARRSNTIVASFSIRRNWSNFLGESRSDLYQDFAYIDGVRVLVNMIILYGHCMMVPMHSPVQNAEDSEAMVTSISTRYITAMFGFTVQIFFSISGLLLTVNSLRDVHRRPNLEPGYFRSKIIQRLIRLLPVYYFFLLMATVQAILPGVELGPLGYCALVREQHICRKNWWINILMINNLPFYDTQCMMHSWYIGADLQLFLFGLTILWMIWKFPHSVKPLFWAMVVISIVLPVGLLNISGSESIMNTRFSEIPFLFMYDKWVREIYQPSYTNINSFIGGMIAGYLYHKTKHDKLNLNNFKMYNFLSKISTSLFILSILPINLFFTHNLPRWAILLHFVLFRNMVVIMVCLGFVRCFQVPEGWFRRMLSSRPLTTASKLCYSAYVIHVLVIRLVINRSPNILHFSYEEGTTLTMITVALSYVASVPVYFCIEQPVGLVLKAWVTGRRNKKMD